MSANAVETEKRYSGGGWIATGVVINMLIVSAPLAVTGIQKQTQLPVLLLCIGSSMLCATEWNQTRRHPECLSNRDRYGLAALIGGLLLLFVQWAAIVEFETRVFGSHPAGIVAGCVFICVGTWLRSTAIQQLATGFRSSLKTSRLVTSGLYARFRHPSETGLMLVMIGVTLLLSAMWTAAIFLPAAYGVSRWRIHLEETELRRAFGAEYAAYEKQYVRPWARIAVLRTEPQRNGRL